MNDTAVGLDILLEQHIDWLAGRRVGLVAHPASVDCGGIHAAFRLRRHTDIRLTCLFGPEHGFSGLAAAGIPVEDDAHADWNIPVFSLYGETRKPTPAMLEHLDVILFDLQDLPVRCYTYSSTLRLMLEAAAECRKAIIVADRPAPLCDVLDGPMLDPALESFVGMIPTPLCYGLTTGELARLLVDIYGWDVDLRVAACPPGLRSGFRDFTHPWIPPSPGIRTRQTALTYPVTVCCEALPALDYGRGHPFIFQVMAAPWMDGTALADHLNGTALPGLQIAPIHYVSAAGLYGGKDVHGIQIHIQSEETVRPAYTMMHLLRLLTDIYGVDRIWNTEGSRTGFFDQLLGSRQPREGLLAGKSPDEMVAEWTSCRGAFEAQRRRVLLDKP